MGPGLALRLASRLAMAIAACSLVVACGTARSERSPLAVALGTAAQATMGQIAGRRGAQTGSAPAPLTRADIEKYDMPILRAVIASRAADALLTISDTKGGIQTWATTDGTSFTLRDGVLIQTRGLGNDLMSSQAPSVGQLLQNGGTHQRQYFFLGENDQPTRRTYDCTVTVKGRETIEIFAKSHAVTRVAEECSRPQGSITNEFWIEGTMIRKSQQWTSGLVGVIEFERVVD